MSRHATYSALALFAGCTLALATMAGAANQRVVTWGDSITYGYFDGTGAGNDCANGHPNNDPPETCGYPGRVGSRLNDITKNNPIWNLEIVNLGKGGETTSEALTRLGNAADACPVPNTIPINRLRWWICEGLVVPEDLFVLMEGSNDMTQNFGVETSRFNLETLGLRASIGDGVNPGFGLNVVLATVIPRHIYACVDSNNSKTSSLATAIRNTAASKGWPLADPYDLMPRLGSIANPNSALWNYYQNWTWMKCDPDLPEPPPASVDPVGHVKNNGYDKIAWDWGATHYPKTFEAQIKGALAPRVTLAQPAPPVEAGTPETFSATLHDLAQTATLTWSFGDGEQAQVVPAVSPATRAHRYYEPGVYTVSVTAAHANGGVRTSSIQVTVTGVSQLLFEDGFASGDVSAWSSSEPPAP